MGNSRQYALIAYLAQQEGGTGRLGKKAVQKFIHILSSVSGKSYGYKFSFYTYGAFSSALAADLDIAGSLGLVTVDYDADENSYSIKATTRSNSFIEKNISQEEKKNILSVWEDYSGKTARELELMSTILFIFDEEGLSADGQDMTDRVEELKPKYSRAEIKKSQQFLSKLYSLDM